MKKEFEMGMARVIETDYSRLSPFAVRLALVDPWKLGTHEDCLEGYNFAEIDFSSEYAGPPIAVAEYDRSDKMYSRLDGKFPTVEIDEYGDLGVLDGRHRLEKARLMGFKLVPVQIIPANHPNLLLGTWLMDFEPLSVEEVLAYFKHPDIHVLPKATKFQALGTDGNLYRLSQIQPMVRVSTKMLKG